MSQPVFVPGVNVYGITVQMKRKLDVTSPHAGMGDDDWVDAGLAIGDCVPVVDQPLAQSLARGGSNEATQSGSLFVPRAAADAIEVDMRFAYQGTNYHIIGKPSWNYAMPLTGEDFGYVEFTIRKGG